MGKKLSIAILGLASICASQSWAGSTGNGWAQPTQTQYAFCYGGNVKVVYISRIITVASTVNMPNLGVTYGEYVKATYGLPGLDRQRCVTAASITDATAEKQRYKKMFGTTKLVEIEWAGASSSAQ